MDCAEAQNDVHAGFQPLDILTEHLEIECDEREQIDLGKQNQVRSCNEERIFRCLVVTSSQAENAYSQVMPQIEFDRAQRIAVSFDDQEIKIVQIQLAATFRGRERRSDYR